MFGNEFQTWYKNFMTIQRWISPRLFFFFLRRVWWYAGKREGFGRRKRENKIERKRGRRKYRQFENWPKMPLFIARVLTDYYLLYFFFVYYFLNKYSSIFPIKWINQISFFFFQTIILIQLFLLIYLIVKTLLFSKTLFFYLKKTFNLFMKNGMLQCL